MKRMIDLIANKSNHKRLKSAGKFELNNNRVEHTLQCKYKYNFDYKKFAI